MAHNTDSDTPTVVTGYHSQDKPDFGWWQTQVHAGIKFREWHASQHRWFDWNRAYEGKFSQHILPINLFFMMARTLVPRLYFRNPSISITPAQPGPDQLGLAMVNERVANKLVKSMNMKREFKRITQETFFYGTSFGKLGFGSEFVAPEIGEQNVVQTGKQPWAKVDYRQGITGNEPWFLKTGAGEVVLPAGTLHTETAPWVCHVIHRPTDDVRRDTRLDNTKNLSGDSGHQDDIHRHVGRGAEDSQHREPSIILWEIWDRRTGNHFIMTPDTNKTKELLLAPTPSNMITRNGGPLYQSVFNQTNTSCWGLPDSRILEPFQREINEINTQIMYHRRLTMRKFIARRGSITEEEAQALVMADIRDIGAVIWSAEPGSDVVPLQIADIPQSLFTALDRVMQSVQFTLGFSRNQFGEFRQGSEAATAKEAQIVQQSSEIRIDERRDMLADMLVNVMSDVLQLSYQHWDEEMVERVVGPWGVPVWVKFTGDMLSQGRYEINVNADSSVPQTKEAREAKAVQTFQLLQPLTQIPNPITGKASIDPQKLTRFLLHSLQGTEYDDMLDSGVPNIYDPALVAAVSQGEKGLQEPITPDQLGQMAQEAPNQGAGVSEAIGGV